MERSHGCQGRKTFFTGVHFKCNIKISLLFYLDGEYYISEKMGRPYVQNKNGPSDQPVSTNGLATLCSI